MYHLKLVKALSFTGIVTATKKNPDVFVEDKATADAAVATGYFKLIEEAEEPTEGGEDKEPGEGGVDKEPGKKLEAKYHHTTQKLQPRHTKVTLLYLTPSYLPKTPQVNVRPEQAGCTRTVRTQDMEMAAGFFCGSP